MTGSAGFAAAGAAGCCGAGFGFGSDADSTHAPRSISYVPSVSVVASETVTLRLAASSAAVANFAVSVASASVAMYGKDAVL